MQRKWWTLIAVCVATFMLLLDITIVNIALPNVARDLDASFSDLQWLVDAYALSLAALLLAAGAAGDLFGHRRVFACGLALFGLGSLLRSVAPGIGWLVAARVVQACGGSMLNPVAMSIITNTFTEPRERAQAVGVWGAVFGISMALGPIVGGALVSSVGWRSIFWINVPVGLAAIGLAARFVPESRAPHPRRIDPVGQLLVLAALASITYAIIEGPDAGWRSAEILGCFGLGAVAVAALLAYEHALVRPDDLRRLNTAFFTMNGVISAAFFLFVLADVLVS